METAGVFGQGACGVYGGVVGVEGEIYDQTPIEHQTGIIDGLEGVVVDGFMREAEEHLWQSNAS